MNIPQILGTNERIKILYEVIYQTGPVSVVKVAEELKVSKGLVSKFLKLLEKEGVLRREGEKYFVRDGVNTVALRILLNLNGLDKPFFSKYKFVKSVGLFGSTVNGTNTIESDMDMWVYIDGEMDNRKLFDLTLAIRKEFGNIINPLYFNKEKINIWEKDNMVIYQSILMGSLTVYGEGIQTVLLR